MRLPRGGKPLSLRISEPGDLRFEYYLSFFVFFFSFSFALFRFFRAHVGGESDHIQGWQGSILKSIGNRWSNPPIYMLVILSLILQCGTIISNSHVGFTLNNY